MSDVKWRHSQDDINTRLHAMVRKIVGPEKWNQIFRAEQQHS